MPISRLMFVKKKLNRRASAVLLSAIATVAWAAPGSEADDDIATAAPASVAESGSDKKSLEQIIAERLEFTNVNSQVVWLPEQSNKFLALFRAAEEQPPNGAVIYIVQPGEIVDNSPLQRVIAEMTAGSGWATLVVQQSRTDISNEDQQARRINRVNAAIDYIRGQSIENIILVGDAEGANIAVQCVEKNNPSGVVAIVGLGFWNESISDSDYQVLEVFGTRDVRAALEHERRQAKTKRRQIPIDTIEIDGADASFRGYEDLVAKRLRGWLTRSTPGTVVKRRRRIGSLTEG